MTLRSGEDEGYLDLEVGKGGNIDLRVIVESEVQPY